MEKGYSVDSAKWLLDRPPDDEYLAEWATLLQKEKTIEGTKAEGSVVIFRLFQEWLAFSTLSFAEVADIRKIHRIPHRTNKILLGVVNLRGQLKLTAALHHLLEVESVESSSLDTKTYNRMLAVRKNEDQWIFPVSEVYGIYRYDVDQLQNVPVTVAKSTANFFKGIIQWKGKSVGYIDDELLFTSLKRMAL